MRVCLEGNALRSFGSISLSSLTGIVQASSDDREPYRLDGNSMSESDSSQDITVRHFSFGM